MNKLLGSIPIFVSVAIAIMFFLLPATPELFTCKACASSNPYLPLLGAGYFTFLGILWLLFPRFPGRYIARGGLLWSVVLAGSLTYVKWPAVCWACMIAHACHVMIWLIWVFAAKVENLAISANSRERLCLLVFAPLCMIAVLASLNLTFATYGFKREQSFFADNLQAGDKIPHFEALTVAGQSFNSSDIKECNRTVINFMSPDCSYCKEQQPIVQAAIAQLPEGSYRFVNISPIFSEEFLMSSSFEWIEDAEGRLRKLFKIAVYPTLFVVDTTGKIRRIFTGVPDQLHSDLVEECSKF